MKVYVSEMPKGCLKCPFYKLDTYVDVYGYQTNSHECVLDGSMLTNSCPLQSITDHDKQVRKEVCEKIRENAISHNNLEVDMYYISPQQLYEIEQGETECQKN